MSNAILERLERDLAKAREVGNYKTLHELETATKAHVTVGGVGEVLLMCSNDYQGFADHPAVVAAARAALDRFGVGPASVRFICGTLTIHEELERKIAEFLHTEAAITYSSCWSANTGLFPVLAGPGDVVISDELNHASIIDGCRAISKDAVRDIYRHADMNDLARVLEKHADRPGKIIVTDGVFSMEGDLAPLPEILRLAKANNALVVVDDSHGVGVVGPTARGTVEHFGLLDHVDIHTGTLGKALGGGAGGYVAGPRVVIDSLIQRSRPHLFSNAVPPAVAAGALESLRLLEKEPDRGKQLRAKAELFRQALKSKDITPLEGEGAIVPVVVGESVKSKAISQDLLAGRLLATSFSFPVVPEGAARIRFQVSQSHSEADLRWAADLIATTFRKHGARPVTHA
ncbi:MAG TPA: aminotransferase class I/II-fold pyridoxal phosphate-dependent enzyme [Rhizomicrobium sp.]|jgi:glycine C-acetyltransferase|nr:aminotransferase class I/II-fold pyridoxal phosphate-dependent enzyme [Rhizomicrobium sp.]